jgi:hypothetical protein
MPGALGGYECWSRGDTVRGSMGKPSLDEKEAN